MILSIKFNRLVPFVQISNAEASIDFYCDDLGFEKEWVFQFDEHSPKNVCVSRSGIKLYLTEFPESAAGTKYIFWIDGFDELVEELNSRSVKFELRLENGDFGKREIRIHDPDQNFIVFGDESGDRKS